MSLSTSKLSSWSLVPRWARHGLAGEQARRPTTPQEIRTKRRSDEAQPQARSARDHRGSNLCRSGRGDCARKSGVRRGEDFASVGTASGPGSGMESDLYRHADCNEHAELVEG